MSTQALKAVATGQGAAERAPTIFDFLEHAKVRKGISAVAGKYLKAERMLTLCVNAVKKTPRLLQCDPQSVLGAMMTSAALGLEPNTAQQQAFLIPYRKGWTDSSCKKVRLWLRPVASKSFRVITYFSAQIEAALKH